MMLVYFCKQAGNRQMCVEGDELKKLSIYKIILGQEVRL